jgi:antitoxin component of MazEF toxin-antitoxin module
MAETIFKGNSIQSGYKIKIPKAVIDTLNLKIGVKIVIRFDAEKRLIIVEEEKKNGTYTSKGR